MSRVHVLAEGQTEETFIRDVLAPYLATKGVYPFATLVKTKRVKDGPDFKGGITSYRQVKNDITLLLRDTNAVAVTTMIDFYGLPSGFPGCATAPAGDPHRRVEHVESEFGRDISDPRFFPFIVLHEFEAVMFIVPEVTAEAFPGANAESQMRAIRESFASPEEINDGPLTAPSKRLIKISNGAYQKPLHGPLVAAAVGLELIRS